ncbi:Biotin synthase [Dirofilaria immitis]
MELDAKDMKIGIVHGIEVVKNDIELHGSKYPVSKENIGFMSLTESEKEEKKPEDSAWRCDDDQSYYFMPLNECYFINVAQFLSVDSDRKIAYGSTRNEYMFRCWQQYRGKLLDIGLNHIGEKISFVKDMIINFNHRSFNRQAIQVGFMINRKHELISQNGEHYDVLDKVHMKYLNANKGTFCLSVCCIVFLADTRTNDVKMLYTSCDNRTRALSYICETPALHNYFK